MSKQLFAVSLLSATLVACGGSSGGGSGGGLFGGSNGGAVPAATTAPNVATTPVTIDAQNEQTVASAAAGGGLGSSRSLSKLTKGNPLNEILDNILLTHQSLLNQSQARVLQTDTFPCQDGGSQTESSDGFINNGVPPVVGDVRRSTTTFDQCDEFGTIENGSMTIQVTVTQCPSGSLSGDRCAVGSIIQNTTSTDKVTGVSLNAQANLDIGFQSLDSDTKGRIYSIGGGRMTLSWDGNSAEFYNLIVDNRWDDSVATSSNALDFTLDLNVTGFVGRLVVDNTVPMASSNFKAYPDSGVTVITGGNGTEVILDASTGDSNTVRMTTNGGIPQVIDWFTLEQQSPIPNF